MLTDESVRIHLDYLVTYNGLRLKEFDDIGVPKGWVLDGRSIDPEVWEHIKIVAFPIKPHLESWNSVSSRVAVAKQLEEIKEKWGEDAFMVVAADQTMEEQPWYMGAVAPKELLNDPQSLIIEPSQLHNVIKL